MVATSSIGTALPTADGQLRRRIGACGRLPDREKSMLPVVSSASAHGKA